MSHSDDEIALSFSESPDVIETEGDAATQSLPLDETALKSFILLFVLSAVAGFAFIYSIGDGLFQ